MGVQLYFGEYNPQYLFLLSVSVGSRVRTNSRVCKDRLFPGLHLSARQRV